MGNSAIVPPSTVPARLTLQYGIVGLIAFVCLSLVGVTAYGIWVARIDAITRGEETTRNLARAIAQHAEDAVRTTDSVLLGAVNRIETLGNGVEETERLHRFLVEQVALLPELKALGAFDATGTPFVTSLPQPVTANYADRDYFVFHRTHSDRAIHIGSPVQSKTKAEWVIPVTRRIDHPDGSFAGVMLATIDIDYFRKFYETFAIGTHGAIALASTDGILLARRPFDPADLGRSLLGSVIFRDLLPNAPAGFAEIRSSTDNVVRFNSYRQTAAYPLVVAAALSKADLLADWRASAWRYGTGVAILVLAIGFLGFRLLRQLAIRGELQLKAEAAISISTKTAAALAESEARLQSILDNVPVGISLKDRDHRYVVVNRQLQGWYDRRVGATLCELHADKDFAAATEAREDKILEDGEIQVNEVLEPVRDGQLRWFLVTKFPVRDQAGAIVGVGTVALDINERHVAEQALQEARDAAVEANRAKSDFLAGMSHEIRTPMNGIIGFADLILGAELSEQQRSRATLIKDSAKSLLAIINDILDIAKIEAGKLQLETIPLSLGSVMDGAVSIVRTDARSKGLELQAVLGPDLPAWILGDPTRIRQILLNLMSNAIKFTVVGGVTVSASRVAADGVVLARFEVADTGCGIPADQHKLLFQNFSQADRSITRRFGGTGLGLAISKRLAESMGGAIGFESMPGRGSMFWFTISLVEAQSPASGSTRTVPHPSAHARILVADDIDVNQLVAEGLLAEAGHEVVIVGNGAEAVDALKAGRFDLVFMDMQMPVMDGIAATVAIRGLQKPACDVPIIALTANGMPEEIARCRAAGMDDHLTKPIDRETLLAAVARWSGVAKGRARLQPVG